MLSESVTVQSGIVGDDEIFGAFCAGYIQHKARTSANTADHAYPAESQWLELGDTERLINALAEFDITSPADIHKFHIFRHSLAAIGLVESELVYEDDFYISAFGVELLHSRIESRFSTGKVGHTFAMSHRPVIHRFHLINIAAAPL